MLRNVYVEKKGTFLCLLTTDVEKTSVEENKNRNHIIDDSKVVNYHFDVHNAACVLLFYHKDERGNKGRDIYSGHFPQPPGGGAEFCPN